MWQQIVLLCAVGVTGVVLAVRPLLRSEPRLDAALDRIYGTRRVRAEREQPQTTARVGGWLSSRLPRALVPDAADLTITDTNPAEHIGRKALYALGGMVSLPLVALTWRLFGLQLPISVTVLGSLLVGLLGFLVPDLALRTKAKNARLDAARAAVAYLLLSSISRAASIGIAATLDMTAGAFNTPAYLRLREVLERARWSAQSPWEALQEEGERTSVPETTEVGDIMRLAGESDAAIIDTLRARSKSLRENLLAKEIQREKSRTVQISIPIGALVLIFVLAALLPSLMSIVGNG